MKNMDKKHFGGEPPDTICYLFSREKSRLQVQKRNWTFGRLEQASPFPSIFGQYSPGLAASVPGAIGRSVLAAMLLFANPL